MMTPELFKAAIIAFYVVMVGVVLYLRFWTESGYWQAIHTGRNFMLQAATVAIGVGFSYLDQTGKLDLVRREFPKGMPPHLLEALRPSLVQLVNPPEFVFVLGAVFLSLYFLTALNERYYAEKIDAHPGQPAHPRKYVDGLTQQPTIPYKIYIAIALWAGMLALLSFFYFLGASFGHGIRWYLGWVILPAHCVLLLVVVVGSFFSRRTRGTEGPGQTWERISVPWEG
jgi:hypothetical protein